MASKDKIKEHADKSSQENGLAADSNLNKDGMAEYAAYYREPPPTYKEISDSDSINRSSTSGKISGQILEGDDAPNRGDLIEPDGTSGSSSAVAFPPKEEHVGMNVLHKQPDMQSPKKKHAANKDKDSNPETDEPLIPPEQKIQRDKTSPEHVKSLNIPVIPSTNIAVAFLVTLCFNLPLGALAVYFSLMATKAYRDGKKEQGAKKARISIYISLFSIVVTVLVVMAVVLMQTMKVQISQKRYGTKTSINL